MKIVFSRKGFDTQNGGGASPIIDGKPVSLPIPAVGQEATTYADRQLGSLASMASRNRYDGTNTCHDDPMFDGGHCWLGQVSAAQGHLRTEQVGEGDVFLFYGLFEEPDTRERHHRIFGYLSVLAKGPPEQIVEDLRWRQPPRPHPHLSGAWHYSNCIWFGKGRTAARASQILRLTVPGGPVSLWSIPGWLRECGLSYHRRSHRWLDGDRLDSARPGQEFVCHIADAAEPRRWLDNIIAEIEREA